MDGGLLIGTGHRYDDGVGAFETVKSGGLRRKAVLLPLIGLGDGNVQFVPGVAAVLGPPDVRPGVLVVAVTDKAHLIRGEACAGEDRNVHVVGISNL